MRSFRNRFRAWLDPIRDENGSGWDGAATVYVERFSAHPLEADAAELYGPPDGYLDAKGVFHKERSSPQDKAVFEIEIRPEDGVYPLPYMARQANGQAWEEECVVPGAPAELLGTRMRFLYPWKLHDVSPAPGAIAALATALGEARITCFSFHY